MLFTVFGAELLDESKDVAVILGQGVDAGAWSTWLERDPQRFRPRRTPCADSRGDHVLTKACRTDGAATVDQGRGSTPAPGALARRGGSGSGAGAGGKQVSMNLTTSVRKLPRTLSGLR
jgi:hypothetical protein